ncbi:HIT family protein [Rhodoblastus acidophilus]|uniref:HIT family protein n=1 Tax=Candidatus Rhodoblastus alkanivorans TaxID=2954117 RepID=A0ABS9Z2K0_9HYPH|nr:HIT family protein [Candidatus Rhodoblastus alkanivorans]MCI4677522.1 HIT family protein [Candidatus Rhodoblastus alkanivorans]MCI4681881.1 HIT family protein [Candidatus Rhodoblastus alkanivorans]MDI4642931.1 HIT family protein [Rhodoblastus acidophilus]
MTFILDPRLAADTFFVGDLALCRALLMNDSRFPWLILVPRRANLSEIHELSREERGLLIEEAAFSGERLKSLTAATKINVGALGNKVSQLHLHVVARFAGDAAWPGPVWGAGTPEPYAPEAVSERTRAFSAALELAGGA